ncbi:MAG: hypothetical protein H7Y11_12730 [Armatimonadetes bacterium]|nr:hypothetical protein [Anaerolineae bacterium]
MTTQIVLTIPEDISTRARQIAQTTEQPVEQVLLAHLKTLATPMPELPLAEQAELEALQQLSDDALWTIAREQMPDDVQARAHDLMNKNTRRTITEAEHAELTQYVERGDQLMLRKAEAASILRERGYAFRQKDFKPQHD